jgi:hypothetical protein
MPRVPPWLGLNVAALTASLAHAFVDHHIGLFGPSSTTLSLPQAVNILLTCLVVAGWGTSLAAAAAGARSGLSAALALSVGWAALLNGAVAVGVAPPPSAGFPYQDIAHVASLVLGALAGRATWQECRRRQVAVSRRAVAAAVALMLAALVVQALLGLQH